MKRASYNRWLESYFIPFYETHCKSYYLCYALEDYLEAKKPSKNACKYIIFIHDSIKADIPEDRSTIFRVLEARYGHLVLSPREARVLYLRDLAKKINSSEGESK